MVKPLSYLSDPFRWYPFKWDVQTNAEMSGSGDGRVWQAQLAPELWMATVEHSPLVNSEAERLDALIRALRGAQEPFLMASPLFYGPRLDPAGAGLVGATVTITTIANNRNAISFAGLPAGYQLSIGDKFSLAYGSNPARAYFGEVSEDVVADSAGATVPVPIFPNLPSGAVYGLVVNFVKPACKVVIMPGSYKVGTIEGRFTKGGSFKIIQKK